MDVAGQPGLLLAELGDLPRLLGLPVGAGGVRLGALLRTSERLGPGRRAQQPARPATAPPGRSSPRTVGPDREGVAEPVGAVHQLAEQPDVAEDPEGRPGDDDVADDGGRRDREPARPRRSGAAPSGRSRTRRRPPRTPPSARTSRSAAAARRSPRPAPAPRNGACRDRGRHGHARTPATTRRYGARDSSKTGTRDQSSSEPEQDGQARAPLGRSMASGRTRAILVTASCAAARASRTSRSSRSAYDVPAAANIFGTCDCSVKPGIVFTSLSTGPCSVTKKSTRATPAQPSASYIATAAASSSSRSASRQRGRDAEVGAAVVLGGVVEDARRPRSPAPAPPPGSRPAGRAPRRRPRDRRRPPPRGPGRRVRRRVQGTAQRPPPSRTSVTPWLDPAATGFTTTGRVKRTTPRWPA